MGYPSPPWILRGYGLQTVQQVECDRLRPLLPSSLEMVSLLPGYTAGGLFVACYGYGSTLEYNELIVVGGLVRYGSTVGAWISHIYVDNPDSVAGGREIWGLPKELAEFSWSSSRNEVTVRQGDRTLCRLQTHWQLPLWTQQLPIPVISQDGMNLLHFEGKANAQFSLTSATATIFPESPFASLNLGTPLLSVYCPTLQLRVEAPQSIRS